MSQLRHLLTQYAPHGVRYLTLDEVACYSDTRVEAADIDTDTFVGVDNLLPNTGGKRETDYLPTAGRFTAYDIGDVLIGNIRPYLKKIWLATNAGGCSADVLVVRVKAGCSAQLDMRFLYALLASGEFFAYDMQHARGAKMPRGDKAAILRYKIPVPPVEVQWEIIRCLELFSNLEEELQTEHLARRRQYAHYRDRLMTFDDAKVPKHKLGDLATVVRGASPRPIQKYLTESVDGVPWIRIGDIAANGKYITETAERVTEAGAKHSRRVKPGDFVLSNSMSFGRPFISTIEGCIHDGWLAISDFAEWFIPDFLYHLLRSAPVQVEFTRRAGMGAVRNLNADIVKAVAVPVPALEEQGRIVNVLDKFDLIVNDPRIGLPAEITARHTQYEHYRRRLLTFDGLTA